MTLINEQLYIYRRGISSTAAPCREPSSFLSTMWTPACYQQFSCAHTPDQDQTPEEPPGWSWRRGTVSYYERTVAVVVSWSVVVVVVVTVAVSVSLTVTVTGSVGSRVVVTFTPPLRAGMVVDFLCPPGMTTREVRMESVWVLLVVGGITVLVTELVMRDCVVVGVV